MKNVGDISKGVESALSALYKDDELRRGIRYINNNPDSQLSELENKPKMVSRFKTLDMMKYAAWNMNPDLYNKHIEPVYEKKAEEERDMIFEFEKKVAQGEKKPSRLKDYIKVTRVLKWDSETMQRLAKIMHPSFDAQERRMKSRKAATNLPMFRESLELPEFYSKYLNPDSELGSYF